MRKTKKLITLLLIAALAIAAFAGCDTNGDEGTATTSATTGAATSGTSGSNDFDASKSITVISREDGSGTRGAFVELFGVEQEDADGNKVDYTTEEANITNSTSVMMTTVAGNKYAIGYISLGSLNDTVTAAKIDGVEATVANIESGDYAVSRPFNIATAENVSQAAQDFIDFIMSTEGQQVIEDAGYIKVAGTEAYSGGIDSGKIVVAGSSSVTPVMEKLKEAYVALNSGVTIEIQQSDSTTGMTAAIDGICDIGMASRELKDSEIDAGLTGTTIAMDGIAVIVNNDNPTTDLTSEQVKNIFMGEITSWADIAG